MKTIDKLYINYNTHAHHNDQEIKLLATKLNQLISSHNELIKIINKLNKE